MVIKGVFVDMQTLKHIYWCVYIVVSLVMGLFDYKLFKYLLKKKKYITLLWQGIDAVIAYGGGLILCFTFDKIPMVL